MSRSRRKIISPPEFDRIGVDLEEFIESWLESSTPSDNVGLLDDLCLALLTDVYGAVGGSEGTVWLAESEGKNLVAVHNSGQHASDLVGFEQPVGSGIISMVYMQQQPYCENDIHKSSGHDDTLDRKMSLHTTAMIAVPFYFGFGLRGVISCVQLEENPGGGKGFDSTHVEKMVRVANLVERLVNASILSDALGMNEG